MDNKVNKEDGKVLVCDVCGNHTDHVVCFNNGKENEVRVCKDRMEEAMGCFEDDEPKKRPEDDEPKKRPEDDCRDCPAKQYRDHMIKGLRDDLKKKEAYIKELKKGRAALENVYNNRIEKFMILSDANRELSKELWRLKESLKNTKENSVLYKSMYDAPECSEAKLRYEYEKLSSRLITRATIACLLSIAVGATMAILLM